jgi:guanine nucleotide-binding protein subunit alpha
VQLAETENRECFFHFTVATDTGNIKTVFESVHTIIIDNNLKDIGVQ